MDGDPFGSRGESQCLLSPPQDGGPPVSPTIRAWPLWAVRLTGEMLQPRRPQGPSTTGLTFVPATRFPSQLLPPQLGSNSPESLPPFPCHPCLAVPSAMKPEQNTVLYAHHGQAGRQALGSRLQMDVDGAEDPHWVWLPSLGLCSSFSSAESLCSAFREGRCGWLPPAPCPRLGPHLFPLLEQLVSSEKVLAQSTPGESHGEARKQFPPRPAFFSYSSSYAVTVSVTGTDGPREKVSCPSHRAHNLHAVPDTEQGLSSL